MGIHPAGRRPGPLAGVHGPPAPAEYDGIVSLHSEYKGESSYRRLTTPQLLTQSAADLMYLKKVVASTG